MKLTRTALRDVVVIDPDVHRDERGFFLETFQERRYGAYGIRGPFVQDNHSYSVRGTLRGLHAQLRQPQGKLIRVISGEVFDVAVDIRPDSPDFGRWVGVVLSGASPRQLWLPPGFAHGFCALSEEVHLEYKCTRYYDPGGEVSVLWNDPEIGIAWPILEPRLSPKDADGVPLSSLGRTRRLYGT